MNHVGLAVKSRFEILRDNLVVLTRCSNLNHGTEVKVRAELEAELRLLRSLRKQVFEPKPAAPPPVVVLAPPKVTAAGLSVPVREAKPQIQVLTLAEKRRFLAQVPFYEEQAAPYKLLWVKAIIRAAYDYALYRDSRDLKMRKYAQDAERWLFGPSELFSGLENICNLCKLPLEAFREWARKLTPGQVKKFEFLERSGKDQVAAALKSEPLLLDEGD